MLLTADWVVPVSAPPIEAGGLRVAGGVITAVGPAAELRARFPEDEVQTFDGCALLPGLVNTHTHLEYSAFRGFAGSCGFGVWMLRLLLARRRLAAEDYAASALWGAYECARCGVTTIADCSYEGWAVARAAGVAGLRARVHQEVFGLDDAKLPDVMAVLERRLERLRGEAAPLVEAGVSPHAPYTVSARLYREAARFARRAGLRLATHVAESPAEARLLARGGGSIARAYRLTGMWGGYRWRPPGVSPVRFVADARALSPATLAVHCVQVDRMDIDLLASSGTVVAHCPRSNARLRCGTAPVGAMRRAGVTVGLGTDSLGSNDDLDLFAEMRAACSASVAAAGVRRAARRPGDGAGASGLVRGAPLSAAEVLRMATLDGARALGWDHLVGSLEPGKRADVIAVTLPAPLSDPVEAIVSRVTAADVRVTMVEGRTIWGGEVVPAAAAAGLAAARSKLGLSAGPVAAGP